MTDTTFKSWKERLNNIDSETVFRTNGAVFSHDGKSFLNPCRHDKRFGSCHFYNGKAWDMAGSGTGKGNVIPNIDAVMALTGRNFLEACDLIARQNGLPTYKELKGQKDENTIADTMPLNDKQIRYLHLQRYGSCNVIKHSSSVKPKEIDSRNLEGEGYDYYWGDTIQYSLDDLYREDKDHEGFWYIIEGKVREWYPFYLNLYKKQVWNPDADIPKLRDAVLKDPCKGLKDAVTNLCERYGLDTYDKVEVLKEISKDPSAYINMDNLDNQYTNPFAGIPAIKDYLEEALKELHLLAEKFGIAEKVKKRRKFALV